MHRPTRIATPQRRQHLMALAAVAAACLLPGTAFAVRIVL